MLRYCGGGRFECIARAAALKNEQRWLCVYSGVSWVYGCQLLQFLSSFYAIGKEILSQVLVHLADYWNGLSHKISQFYCHNTELEICGVDEFGEIQTVLNCKYGLWWEKKGISGYSFLYAATMFSPPCLDNKTCEWEFIIFTPFCGLGLFQEEYKLIIYGCNVLYLSVRPPFWNCEKNLSVPISKFFRLGFVLLGKNDLSDAALRKKTYNRLTQPSDWRSM